jgi:hypothetical protein
MSDDDNSRAGRAAQNQSLYRQVNESVVELNESFDALVPFGSWVCECANGECFAAVEMTHAEYEAVRAVATTFLVKPDAAHVFAEVENVTERHERYWVVEKIGAAAEVAERKNPRAGQR